MKFFEIILIAIGLSMDAFAVSITSGVTINNLKVKHALKIAAFFGIFQAVMPLIGYLAGISLNKYITSYDHWIAFILLAFIGGKMIYEGFQIEKCEMNKDCLNSVTLLVLAIATSIDALAVGVVFSSLSISVLMPVAIIGLITFVICFAGVYIGDKFGSFFEKKMELIGGSVLILIGVKILVEHLMKGN